MIKSYSLFCIFTVIGVLLSCNGDTGNKSSFREYTETTTKSRFGAMNNITSGAVSSGEIDLFNQITSSQALVSGISWTVPTGWKEVKETGVRLVSFRTRTDLEVTLIAFPGQVGGIRANIVRWLGQIQVNLNDSELDEFITKLKIGKTVNGRLSYFLVDFENYLPIVKQDRPQTILAAVFAFTDQMLFVKLSGDKGLVKADKNDFLNFVKSINSRSI